MIGTWITLILLGIGAGFMPAFLGVEAYVLGSERGPSRVAGMLFGLTLARLIIAFGVFSVFASVLEIMRRAAGWAATSAVGLLAQINRFVVSDGHWLVDLLLVLAGALLIFEAIAYLRRGSEELSDKGIGAQGEAPSEPNDGRSPGLLGALGMGLLLGIVSVKQWVFTVAAVNLILRMPPDPLRQMAALSLYLLVGVALVAIPLVIYLVRPERATLLLERLNRWINGAVRYLIVAIICLVGFYLVWNGIEGMARSFPTVSDRVGHVDNTFDAVNNGDRFSLLLKPADWNESCAHCQGRRPLNDC